MLQYNAGTGVRFWYLSDYQKKEGFFTDYPSEELLDVVVVISCQGCPAFIAPVKLLMSIRGLTEFRVHTMQLSYCRKALSPFD